MPMVNKEDFAGGIIGHAYCLHCVNPVGELRTYEEVLQSFSDFIIEEEGLTEEEAREMARKHMHQQPAWKHKAEEEKK